MERPPCWRDGQCPNDCARALHNRIVYNITPLHGPWAGWRMAGARLVNRHGEWVAPHLLDRWLYQHSRLYPYR